MSEFSEAIKGEIKKSGQTLLYLSDASGLSLDHISKMRQGKRLPQDAEKVRKLIMALQCSEKVSQTLFSLYKKERMGREEWDCMQEIKKLLEAPNGFLESSAEPAKKPPKQESMRKVRVLNSRTEVLSFLQKMLPTCSSVLRMATEEIPEAVVELLALSLNQFQIHCEHLFSLKTIRVAGGSLYNLRFINRIMPLIRSGKNYFPYYDYEEKADDFLPNWLICDQWAVGLQRDMESGIVIWEEEQISYLRRRYERKKKNKRSLLRHFSDIDQWAVWITENRKHYLSEIQTAGFRPQDVKNYYMEYGPCFLNVLSVKLLEKHLLLGEPEKSGLIQYWILRKQQIDQEKAVHFFTREGLEYSISTGRLSEIPEQIYTPFSIPERIELLEKFLAWVKEPDARVYMLDDRQLNLPIGTFVYSTVSMVDNELILYLGREDVTYCSVIEQGIADKLNRFCHMLEEGEMICPQEECERIIGEMIEKLRGGDFKINSYMKKRNFKSVRYLITGLEFFCCKAYKNKLQIDFSM